MRSRRGPGLLVGWSGWAPGRSWWALALVGALLAGGCTSAAPSRAAPVTCGSAAPDAVPLTVSVRDGRAEPAPHRVTVATGSPVLLGVRADAATEVHVHGFDLVYPVPAGESACVLFVADRAGLFDVEAHPETLLLQLEVR